VALRPGSAPAHSNLGTALKDKGRVDEAIAEHRQAIALDPKYALAHNNLGVALQAKGRLGEAIAEYRQAIALDPRYAPAHNNLGVALQAKGRLGEAIAECQKAIALDPRYAPAHNNLGVALAAKGRLGEAIAEYRKAIDLDPRLAPAHFNLGNALGAKGRVDEAIAEYHKAIDLDPKYAKPHGALGHALLQQGRFAEARAATRRALNLLLERDPLRALVVLQLRACERLLALDEKLPALLKGDTQPADNQERLLLAYLCRFKKRHAAAARFFSDAFAAEPKLADDLGKQFRYHAACSAALAAAGKGQDAAPLDAKERARLRQQALTWLRADLAAWGQLLEKGPKGARAAVARTLRHWQQDADLAPVRGKEALGKLPDPERQQWGRLWEEVAALLKKAEGKKPDEAPPGVRS
jgi:Flp pilus assembly protein TadD